MVGSLLANTSRPPSAFASSVASELRLKVGWAAPRAATIANASGSIAHRAMISSAASGSATTRRGPRRRASSSRDSLTLSRSRTNGWAALRHDKAGKLTATCDQRQRTRAAGKQRTHLLGVAGVVQHHQNPAVREHAAVQRRPGIEIIRDP
jgi:hypothetical protein